MVDGRVSDAYANPMRNRRNREHRNGYGRNRSINIERLAIG